MTKKENPKITKDRKDGHINICSDDDSKIVMINTNGFEDIHFIHRALPKSDFDDIKLNTEFLKHKLDFPILFSSITGGTPKAKKINQILARVAEKYNICLGVGSQRPAIEDPTIADTYSIVREEAPNAFIAGNIGAIQLNNDYGLEEAKKAIDMIDANALFLHLNPLQEAIQPEGQTNFGNLIDKIEDLCNDLKQPIIVKEVGSGISMEDAEELLNVGVEAIEVAGVGGTSWAKIESIRAQTQGFEDKQSLGDLFANWGLPTALSTLELGSFREDLQIISSGGIRTGIEGAKAINIGADLVGFALPILRKALLGEIELELWLDRFIQELKTTMFLVGATNIEELIEIDVVLTGKAERWANEREF
ncbi:MAG: type 2 isopentenyl-diphosphate Delta-isomerase [Candidatus Heimdallarchaeota archaeon]